MISIRSAQTVDDKAIKGLILGILEKEFPADEKAYFGSDIERVSKTYSNQGDRFFVACDGSQIVGTVGVKREDERHALLRRIFVRDDYRGQKIGSQLIRDAIAFCRDQGYGEVIFKTTSRMREAIRLCQANGFVKRATIRLGGLDLLKFTFHINDATAKGDVSVRKKEERRKS